MGRMGPYTRKTKNRPYVGTFKRKLDIKVQEEDRQGAIRAYKNHKTRPRGPLFDRAGSLKARLCEPARSKIGVLVGVL